MRAKWIAGVSLIIAALIVRLGGGEGAGVATATATTAPPVYRTATSTAIPTPVPVVYLTPFPDPTSTPSPSPTPTPAPYPPLEAPGCPLPDASVSQWYGCTPYYTGTLGDGCPANAPWHHDGLDLAAQPETPVYSGIQGRVTFAGEDTRGPQCRDHRGYGLVVVVDNDDWSLLYGHLSGIDVRVGEEAAPGTVIGYVGDTGCVSGPHLHFGVRLRGDEIDPAWICARR